MEQQTLNVIIGALIGATGSIAGGIFATNRNIAAQKRAQKEERELKELREKELIKTNAKILYLNSIFAIQEGFLFRKKVNRPGIGRAPILIPLHGDYQGAIASLDSNLNGKELMQLYNLCGIIEKIRHDINELNFALDNFYPLELDYLLLIAEVFQEKYGEIQELEAYMITNDYIAEEVLKTKYGGVFKKLREIGRIT